MLLGHTVIYLRILLKVSPFFISYQYPCLETIDCFTSVSRSQYRASLESLGTLVIYECISFNLLYDSGSPNFLSYIRGSGISLRTKKTPLRILVVAPRASQHILVIKARHWLFALSSTLAQLVSVARCPPPRKVVGTRAYPVPTVNYLRDLRILLYADGRMLQRPPQMQRGGPTTKLHLLGDAFP
jgi:hypothetical protein